MRLLCVSSRLKHARTRPTPSACRRRGSFIGSLRFIICQKRRYDRSVIEPFKGSARPLINKSWHLNGDRSFHRISRSRHYEDFSMIHRFPENQSSTIYKLPSFSRIFLFVSSNYRVDGALSVSGGSLFLVSQARLAAK